ncbi:MAG: zinc finger domain-containing protein, partial [Bacillota bacterium]
CVQDILWGARLHPQRPLGSLTEAEVRALWEAMREVLRRGIAEGGSDYEKDLYGCRGGWSVDKHFAVGYREGRPCPRCGAPIQRIRTGQTSTFICPNCQVL